MSTESEYFFNSGANIVLLDCLEISHSSFSKTYRIVRNAIAGVTVTHEDRSSHDYEYRPISLKPVAASDDLDQILEIQLGDLGAIVPQEIARARAADTMGEKPVLKYRTYRSDDLTQPLTGPFIFELKDLTRNYEGTTFQATAPRLNQSSTGERYTMDRFTMLKGFI